MQAYEYRHIVGFEETNVVGNVYYSNYISWQGRCREMFLRENVPEILKDFSTGLALVTLRVNCEYFREVLAFDELMIRMRLADLSRYRMLLTFDYWRRAEPDEELVARGEQELACMRRSEANAEFEPAAWPEYMHEALRPYAKS